METEDDAYRFGLEIAALARARAAQVKASCSDPADLDRQLADVEACATRACSWKLMALKRDGMPVHRAEAWAEGTIRGYRDGRAQDERIHRLALLRRIADRADTPADRVELAERVGAYLAGAPDGLSLDAAFGLSRSAGGLPWWRVQALADRDAALRALAARFYGDLPISRQATRIRSALLAYGASAWRLDRREVHPPRRYVGTAAEIMFDAMRACPDVPSARQIRRILKPCGLAMHSGF